MFVRGILALASPRLGTRIASVMPNRIVISGARAMASDEVSIMGTPPACSLRARGKFG